MEIGILTGFKPKETLLKKVNVSYLTLLALCSALFFCHRTIALESFLCLLPLFECWEHSRFLVLVLFLFLFFCQHKHQNNSRLVCLHKARLGQCHIIATTFYIFTWYLLETYFPSTVKSFQMWFSPPLCPRSTFSMESTFISERILTAQWFLQKDCSHIFIPH